MIAAANQGTAAQIFYLIYLTQFIFGKMEKNNFCKIVRGVFNSHYFFYFYELLLISDEPFEFQATPLI